MNSAFDLYAGIPKHRRNGRYVMAVQLYVDESGTYGNDKYFYLAGVFGTKEQWDSFSEVWSVCLQCDRKIDYFKMREAARCQEQFLGFSPQERDAKLRDLAQVINLHELYVSYIGYEVKAFDAVIRNQAPKPYNDPYIWAFDQIIHNVCDVLVANNYTGRFDIFFDEDHSCELAAKQIYPALRAFHKVHKQGTYDLLPNAPMFESDLDFLPLQAADFFAWNFRRSSEKPSDPGFAWLMDELHNCKVTENSGYLNEDVLRKQWDMTSAYMPNVIAEWGKLVDVYNNLIR